MASPSALTGSSVRASIYRRLAEAVEGYSGAGPVWFVLDRNLPHNLFVDPDGQIAFASEEIAARALEASGREPSRYTILGPCRGEAEPQQYEIVSVKYRAVGSDEIVERQVPAGSDMLCWSLSAFDKFFAPYYADVLGFDDSGRNRLGVHRDRMAATGFFLHIWPTIGRGFGIRPPETGLLPTLEAGTTLDGDASTEGRIGGGGSPVVK